MSTQSWTLEDSQVTDPFVAVFASPSSPSSILQRSNNLSPHSLRLPTESVASGEREPLLPRPTPYVKKPFYRARPLWLVPFAVIAALVRGMTLAPRIEVFTQLSCAQLHRGPNHTAAVRVEPAGGMPSHAPLYFGIDPLGPQFSPEPNGAFASLDLADDKPWDDSDTGGDDPMRLPSLRCMADPAVQAGAARLQTMFTTIMGFLSALTTGWWGHFSERHGRTKVLSFATLGLFFTDLIFILASSPSSPFSFHGHKLLLVAPVIEGLLGGYSTLQSATSAYISDCTSSGSRASMFSRFTGVTFIGLGLGPILGGWLIRHPIAFLAGPPQPGAPSLTSVFCVAAGLQFINLCLVLFIYPESVSKERREIAGKGKAPDHTSGNGASNDAADELMAEPQVSSGVIRNFLKPLSIFLPVPIFVDGSTRKRKDWSLTFLACAMFGYMLSSGLYQIKYLYAGHVYGWGAEQLSYYISLLSSTRALFLLFVLPYIISTFKPKPKVPNGRSATATTKAAKPKPTKSHIAREIKFDLGLSRFSLCIEIVANLSIVLAPGPSYKIHSLFMNGIDSSSTGNSQIQNSQTLFILASWMQCMGAGVTPAIQSLALCILQARSLLMAEAGQAVVDTGTGTLFGALAVLQSSGQMVLGPLLFGVVYSGTVATVPKTIFVTAAAIMCAALAAIMLVRSPLSEPSLKGKVDARRRRRIALEEENRGRSRVSKDLRYGSTSPRKQLPPPQASSSGSGSV